MNKDSLVPAYTKRGTIHETYAGTFSKKYLLYKDSQRNSNGLLEFHKTIV